MHESNEQKTKKAMKDKNKSVSRARGTTGGVTTLGHINSLESVSIKWIQQISGSRHMNQKMSLFSRKVWTEKLFLLFIHAFHFIRKESFCYIC